LQGGLFFHGLAQLSAHVCGHDDVAASGLPKLEQGVASWATGATWN